MTIFKPHRRVERVTLAMTLLTALAACGGDDEALPERVAELPFLQPGWSEQHGGALPGQVTEVRRSSKTLAPADELALPKFPDVLGGPPDRFDEVVPAISDLSGVTTLELFDTATRRFFAYSVDRQELARASRAMSDRPNEALFETTPINPVDVKSDQTDPKSWSDSGDSRIRRAVGDGFPDNHTIYQSVADYGGCSATVLTANPNRMVAITAAHCAFSGNNFSSAKLRPRNDGATSPTWGSWSVYIIGYYPAYLNLGCQDDFINGCGQHDIALLVASPDPGSNPPRGMGWGYQPKAFLDEHTKYRRGYPSCSFVHSPNNCSVNRLYGDGRLTVGEFNSVDADGWNRVLRHSSDTNPGDSGSSLYYYDDGIPYVFAVHFGAPRDCDTDCEGSRPNFARKITPQFYDFINSLVF